jgi:hypothetical protein
MRPGQLSRQRLDYLEVFEYFGKTDHVEYIAAAKSSTVLDGESIAHKLNHLGPILSPDLAWQRFVDALSDLPIKKHKRRVHRLSDVGLGLINEWRDAADELL